MNTIYCVERQSDKKGRKRVRKHSLIDWEFYDLVDSELLVFRTRLAVFGFQMLAVMFITSQRFGVGAVIR